MEIYKIHQKDKLKMFLRTFFSLTFFGPTCKNIAHQLGHIWIAKIAKTAMQ